MSNTQKKVLWGVIIGLVIIYIFFIAWKNNESVPNPVQQTQTQQAQPTPCTTPDCLKGA